MSQAGAPIIRCRGLAVGYGREQVLRGVDLDVPRGVFLPFVGPNGAGKTTLLRAILGLLRPMVGTIETPFGETPPGYVPQQKAIDPLYPLTAWQIAAMGLYPRLGWWRRPTAGDNRLLEAVFDQLGLDEHRDKTYRELSGGTKQKTMIARALVSGADVFIMDEPTSELDETSEIEVLRHLVRLSREEGKTVLLACHALDHVESVAERVCLVDHGRLRMACVDELHQVRTRLRNAVTDESEGQPDA
jgi:ABC-type Mn2+/Zn2+ transport system ATPase subunit